MSLTSSLCSSTISLISSACSFISSLSLLRNDMIVGCDEINHGHSRSRSFASASRCLYSRFSVVLEFDIAKPQTMPKRARSLSPSDALSSIRLKPGESSGPRVPAHGIILRSDLAAARRLETKTEDDPHGGLIPCSVIMNGTSTVHWVDR